MTSIFNPMSLKLGLIADWLRAVTAENGSFHLLKIQIVPQVCVCVFPNLLQHWDDKNISSYTKSRLPLPETASDHACGRR